MSLEAFSKTNATQVILWCGFVSSSQGWRGLPSNSKVKHVVFKKKYSISTAYWTSGIWKKQQLDKYTEAVSRGQMAWKQNLSKIQNI